MTSLQLLMLTLYGGGVLLFLVVLVKLFYKGKAEEIEPRLTRIEKEMKLLLAADLEFAATLPLPMQHMTAEKLAAERIGKIALDVNVGILEATRSSERRLSKAAAEDLLGVLRDELAITPSDLPPEQMVQSVRARLIRLTEMMAEAQLGLCDISHRVIDIESVVKQLPEVINSHRDGILSLQDSINEIRTNYATKAEVKSIEKDLEWLKWTFSGILGVILVIVGFLLTKL